MCGIVGYCATKCIDNRDWLAIGRDTMIHRGPDDKGEYWSNDGRVGFAHRRLSIIDPTKSGHQPMQTKDGQLCITYNGEIYNFQGLRLELEGLGHYFHSMSDTEVILAAYRQWGKDCVLHLNGMFAFAIYDQRTSTVFLARDRAGEKPLFFHHHNGELRFSSELKALLADKDFPRQIDRQALDCYLLMGYIPGDLCILKGTHKLPAAHALLFDCAKGSIKVWRYWELPELKSSLCRMPEEELLYSLENLLQDAVRRQLVADVPVGILLSGGVDSSLITALAAHNSGRLKTYTVGFKNYPQYDESKHAELIARHFDTDHTLLEVDDIQPDILLKLVRQYDEPMVDSSMIPTYLVSKQISQHCKVALGGDGGDELFGGYYSASRMAALQQNYSKIPKALRRGISRIGISVIPMGFKGRHFLNHLGTDIKNDIPLFMPQFDLAIRKRLLAQHANWPFVAEGIRRERIPHTSDAVQRVTRFDFANYMAEDILVKVDRASMLNSLEIRSPFLDLPVIEFAYSQIPSALKATPVDRKIILKKMATRLLPPEFDKKRKMGFGIPIGHWLKEGPWRKMAEDVLLDRDSIFSPSEVTELFAGIDANRSIKEHVFSLMVFELWRREYGVTI
jgi:asparagine synthase (glutamine-hydrolysing)